METFGGIAVDVPASALSGFDAQLGAELRRWLTAEPGRAPDGFTLAWLITARIRIVGRLRLWEPLLTVLAEIRRRHAEHLRDADPFADAFLDAVLGGVDEESYLALPLLRLVAADPSSNLDPDRLCTLLLADLLWHERFADPVDHPDPAAHARRTERIMVCIAQNDPTMGTAVPAPPGTAAGEWLTLTALPMTTAHDEYLVIRVLQAYELVFAQLTDLVSRATAARADRPDLTAVLVRRAAYGFERATALAALLAGARPDGLEALTRSNLTRSNLTGPDLTGTNLTGMDVTGTDPARLDLAAPAGYRRFERALRELTAAEPDHGCLAAAVAALETSRRAWKDMHDATAARLCPTPATPHAGVDARPRRKRPARPPLVDRAAAPARARVGTPITLRALTPAADAPPPADAP